MDRSGIIWLEYKYTSNSSKGCILEVDLEYTKVLHELHNDYPLAPDKIEIKREVLSESQLKTADLCNIPIGIVKKLESNLRKVFDSLWGLTTLLETRTKTKKNTACIRIQSIAMVKTIYWIKRTKKNKDKDGKALCKLMNHAIYSKIMENVRNRIDVKLVNNENDYLKCTSKPSYMLYKMFDNNLVAIRKSRLALKLNKTVCIRICILEQSEVLMYELFYDYIKNKYGNKSKLLFTDTDSLTYGIKTKDVYEHFSSNKENFDFSNYSTKSKHYDSNKLVIGKMKD